MYYVMSDLHGEYEKYLAMLEKIRFSEEDTLFVLGDVVDRGPDPIRLLQDMSGRENVYLLKGNHEAMACYVLRELNVEITESNAESHMDMSLFEALLTWQHNGGEVTLAGFHDLSPEMREDLLDYMEDTPLYDVVEAGGRTFILTHAGLNGFQKGKKLSQYTADELTMQRFQPDTKCFDDPDTFLVFGHTPVMEYGAEAKILRRGNNFLIDCGAAFGGRLGCLCLDTLEEFYC